MLNAQQGFTTAAKSHYSPGARACQSASLVVFCCAMAPIATSTLQARLADIVGPEQVLDSPDVLQGFSRDQSLVAPHPPDMAVRPREVAQVQQVLRLANGLKTPLVPHSSGLNLQGAAVPSCGGILLDLSLMNRIIDVHAGDMLAVIEPGVTYARLQDELEPQGLRLMVPLGVPPGRSVLTSYLERDPLLAGASIEYGQHLVQDTEMVLPGGELFRTGCWNLGGRPGSPFGPGLNSLYRLWTGAQGTLGVFTKMVVSIQHLSPRRRFYFIALPDARALAEAFRAIQRREIGWECFALNRFNLAALLARDWPVPHRFPALPRPSEEFRQLRADLPPWTLIIGISGLPCLPDEWVSIQEDALHEVCAHHKLCVAEALPGHPDLQATMLRESLRPWGILKKHNWRGTVQSLMFKVPLKRLASIEAVVRRQAEQHGYASEDVGGYAVVLERGRAVHCEFDLHCGPHNAPDRQAVKRLWLAASAHLLEAGALFDRPYGAWAEMVYARAPAYFAKLRQIKQAMDPQGILNPGRLGMGFGLTRKEP